MSRPPLGSGSMPRSSLTFAAATSRLAAARSAARAAPTDAFSLAVALASARSGAAFSRASVAFSLASAAPTDAFSAARARPSAMSGWVFSRASVMTGPALSTACSHADSKWGRTVSETCST